LVQLKNKICLIGGKGEVVLEAAISLSNKNILFKIILIEDNYNISKKFPSITQKYSLKNFTEIIKKIKELEINKILIIGYVVFPKFNQIKFDMKSKLFLTKNYFLNSESSQTKIFKSLLMTKNIKLLSPIKYLQELIISPIEQIKFKDFDKYKKILTNNISNIKKISSINIGQSIIINGNRILALENFKGTDVMITLFDNTTSYNNLIFIKFKKSNQINEIDFPVIGIDTIKNLIKIKIKAIILFKNQTLIVNKVECIKLIKKNKINLIII
jgi:DUF1009 family protein